MKLVYVWQAVRLLPSSPSRGTWIEIVTNFSATFTSSCRPLTGDVD